MLDLGLQEIFSPLNAILGHVWQFIKNWWWVPAPFLLLKFMSFFWLWWRIDKCFAKQKFILLEIRMPKEILRPVRAMEVVFTGIWQIYTSPNWKEKWWDGEYTPNVSLEIASINGEIHFFIRILEELRDVIEAQIYSQYPEAEISLAEDYTKKVPQDIPNKEWKIWGCDYINLKPNPYPIKTYAEFEREGEKPEMKVDPLSTLLEGLSKLKTGEQMWLQIKITPVLDEIKWIEEGEKIVDEITGKSVSKAPDSFSKQVVSVLSGKVPGAKEEEKPKTYLPDLTLTPGQKDVVKNIEKKISKLGFDSNIRFLYIGKKDVFFTANVRLLLSYFTNFVTNNMQSLIPFSKTKTKVNQNWYDWFWFVERRVYLKKRRIFRKYVNRLSPFYPLEGGTFILTPDELATIYHFPSHEIASSADVSRVEAKKGEPPLKLPLE